MVGVILTGHGRFASGLHQAVCQVIGEQPQFVAVDFPEGVSTETLGVELRQAIKACDQGDGIVFLTDILGGSPFRLSSLLSMESGNREVITGTNMQLVVEMLLERDELTATEFRDQALICARKGVTSLWHESQKERLAEYEEDVGI